MILTQRQLEKMGLDQEPAKKPKGAPVRFGARRFRTDDGLSTKPAPGPKGPPAETLIEEANRRRRERADEERSR